MEAATYIVWRGGAVRMAVPKNVVLQMATGGGSKSGSILMYSNFKMTSVELKQTFLQHMDTRRMFDKEWYVIDFQVSVTYLKVVDRKLKSVG